MISEAAAGNDAVSALVYVNAFVPEHGQTAALMAATQRPVTQAALTEPLPAATPAWKTIPTWCVFGDQDLNIPVAAHRAGAQRADARVAREVPGGSHALSVSQPSAVAETILAAVASVATVSVGA